MKIPLSGINVKDAPTCLSPITYPLEKASRCIDIDVRGRMEYSILQVHLHAECPREPVILEDLWELLERLS